MTMTVAGVDVDRRRRLLLWAALSVLLLAVFTLTYNTYPGVLFIWARSQGAVSPAAQYLDVTNITTHAWLAYAQYPLEYGFPAGMAVSLIMLASVPFPAPWSALAVALGTVWLEWAFLSASLYILLVRFRVDPVAAGVLAMSPAVLLDAGVSVDWFLVFLLLLGLWEMNRGHEARGAALLATGALGKLFGLFFLLPALRHSRRRLRFTATAVATVVAELGAQVAMGFANFARASSFLTAYRPEGSWLGLLFGYVQMNVSSWIIPTRAGTIVHIEPWQVISLAMLLVYALALTLRPPGGLEESAAAFFLLAPVLFYISAPQFLFYTFAMTLLSARARKALPALWAASLAAALPVWAVIYPWLGGQGEFVLALVWQVLLLLAWIYLYIVLKPHSSCDSPQPAADI